MTSATAPASRCARESDRRGELSGRSRSATNMLRLKMVFAHRAHARILAIDDERCAACARCCRGAHRQGRAAQPLRPHRSPISRCSATTSCASTAIASRSLSAKPDVAADAGARALRVEYEDLADRRRPARGDAADRQARAPIATTCSASESPRRRRCGLRERRRRRRGRVHDVSGKNTRICSPMPASPTSKSESTRRRNRRTVAARRSPAARRDARARPNTSSFATRRSAARSAAAKISRAAAGRARNLDAQAADGDSLEPRRVDHRPSQAPSVSSSRPKWGAQRDGTIVAAQTTLIADGGAYASTSVEVLKGAMIVRAAARTTIENVSVDGYVCTPTTCRAARSAASVRRKRTSPPSR